MRSSEHQLETELIQKLTGLEYGAANKLLFEVIEYVEPRMKADQAYPPVVGVSVKTVQRRLNRALPLLVQKLRDLQPDGSQQA